MIGEEIYRIKLGNQNQYITLSIFSPFKISNLEFVFQIS